MIGLVGLGVGCADTDSYWFRSSLAQDDRRIADTIFPDERRTGITGLQRKDALYDTSHRDTLRNLAAHDESAAVRAQALRALNQARDVGAIPLFVAGLSDVSPAVRLEAAKALRHLPTEPAIVPLQRLAGNEDEPRDVRIWATTALAGYSRLEVARALVPLLSAREFGVSYAARESLRKITGKDFHYDEGLWLTHLSGAGVKLRVLPKPF